jgi:hypothetical protein
MKKENVINSCLGVIIIIGAVMKIKHIEYSNSVLIFGLLTTNLFQSWLIRGLRKKVSGADAMGKKSVPID